LEFSKNLFLLKKKVLANQKLKKKPSAIKTFFFLDARPKKKSRLIK